MTKTVYQTIAEGLTAYDTSIVFGLPSDDLLLMKEMKDQGIEFVAAKDQRNAVFMAIGYALSSTKLGVCSVGKGPAVSNCITGLLEGESQSVPLLIIASSTGTQNYGDKKSFQEARQIEMVAPIVKWSHRLENAQSIGWVLKKAVYLAMCGTPGPVYIEIPEDIGTHEIIGEALKFEPLHLSQFLADPLSIQHARVQLMSADRPLLVLGGGSKRLFNREIIREFADWLGGPVFATASGRGSFDEEHPLFCGLAGLYCPPKMHDLVAESDLILTVGSKLEETALFGWEEVFQSKDIIQINISPEGFNLCLSGLKLLGDGGLILKELMDGRAGRENIRDWNNRVIKKNKQLIAAPVHIAAGGKLKVATLLKEMKLQLPSNTVFVHENGLQDMWSYFYPYHMLKKGQDAIVPSEQTSLGFGAAAAVGVSIARSDQVVVAIVGDGAFNLFQSDISTLLSQGGQVIYVILRNGGYGWLEYQNRFNEGSSAFINMKRLALLTQDTRLEFISVEQEDEVGTALKQALEYYASGKSVLIECNVEITDVPGPLKEIYGDFPVKERK
ncbi:thiamine pyrophosphate-binding protein [Peribacillus simplex]|uniref:thiamine pyrophosphate-binding protein n=1 Tax=Peribacillus simplex TaxID=1478 RepID=UPI000F634EB7|nr:thiamine pyrophosphate-binding protein [Peribacillus simplex]RRN69537.1 thiamine pyrophosphate-binding protein [Peribacillus simplex]